MSVFESPWPIIVCCTVVSLIMLFRWSQNRQGKFLIFALLAQLLCGVGLAVDGLVVTEPEKIEQQVRDLCFAFQRGESERAASFFSADIPELRQLVEQASRMVRVGEDLRVSDVSVNSVGTPPCFVVRFRANATVYLKTGGSDEQLGRQPSCWEVVWKKESAGWKIAKLTRLNPINQREMQVFEMMAQ